MKTQTAHIIKCNHGNMAVVLNDNDMAHVRLTTLKLKHYNENKTQLDCVDDFPKYERTNHWSIESLPVDAGIAEPIIPPAPPSHHPESFPQPPNQTKLPGQAQAPRIQLPTKKPKS